MSGGRRTTVYDPRAANYEALREAEMRGARIVLDAIADTGFFGIAGEYGTPDKRDEFIRRVLAAADGAERGGR